MPSFPLIIGDQDNHNENNDTGNCQYLFFIRFLVLVGMFHGTLVNG